jgi:histidinol phosphatase-like PHP family hydrolase
MNMKKIIPFILLLTLSLTLSAQKKVINLPNLPGYITLKCDFHMHTVFSDGDVWPIYRVDEAWKDGLDVIAISDHLEYQPKQNYIKTDHNAAWNIAGGRAAERNIILLHSTEITRSMPPGHLNALFVTDATPIDLADDFEAVEAAVSQGAFIQWNHPGWKSQEKDGIPKIYDIHKKLFDKGYIHGIEFFNETEYYPNILSWCKEKDLAVTANSDIHGIISESYGHTTRPMTLVYAKERTEESLKEAMFDARTIAYFNNSLAGPEELLHQFFDAAISVGEVYHENENYKWIEVLNNCDIPFILIEGPDGVSSSFVLEANTITTVRVSKAKDPLLVFRVKNVLTAYDTYLEAELK